MSKIEELIKQLCPEGVNSVKLSSLCNIKTGKLNANAMVDDGKYPFFTCSDIVYRINTFAFDTEALLVAGNGYLGNVKYYNGKFNAYQRTYVLDRFNKKTHIKFVYHYMIAFFYRFALSQQKEGSVPYITVKAFDIFEIPLPPLSIQEEIVRILDTFVEQQELLEKLINLRKKQYEYYREELLTPKKGEEWEIVPIRNLGSITRGRRFVRDDVRESGMPCIHYGDMYTYYGITSKNTKTFLDRDFPKKMQYAKKGDVVVVGAGENDLDIGVGTVWEGEEPVAVHDACYILKHKQNAKYIAYFFRTNNYHQQLRKCVSEGKICSISGAGLGSVLIPIPNMEKQNEIVNLLDKFESNVASLISALEASKTRYTHYRDQLLNFKIA